MEKELSKEFYDKEENRLFKYAIKARPVREFLAKLFGETHKGFEFAEEGTYIVTCKVWRGVIYLIKEEYVRNR